MPRAGTPRARWRAALAAPALAALLLPLALAACDTAPGPPDAAAPPSVAAFTFTPQEVVLDTDDPQVQVPVQMTVTLAGAAPGTEVRYAVRPQFEAAALAEGQLPATGQGNRYAGTATLTLDRGATGLYAVTVYAVGPDGRLGDQAQGLLRFGAPSLGPPVVEAVDYPAVVQRPASGQPPAPVPVVATVSDPDGLRNVARVVLRAGGSEFPLRDDGGVGSNSGDATAGDGRFTVTLQVESTNEPGVYDFSVVATDRAGLTSEPAPVTITIE